MTMTGGPTASETAPWLDGIVGSNAQDLIESNAKVIRVVAGPGSGKTTCLKRRVQRLIQKDGIDPKTMFVGTFTRAVAGELRDALGEDIRVSTLHSLAYEFLRKYPEACQGMRLRFLLKYEEDALLYDVEASELGDIHKRRKALRLLQASRSQRTEYENAAFAGEVRRWLQRHRGMLIGEVVYLSVVGLESNDIPAGTFDYVVIDEYQDLTAAEQELVSFIWSEAGALTVMGDDDQSIYGFRFNRPNGINDFNQDWPECKDLTFVENRRCGERILKTANLMMAEAGTKKPQMVSRSDQQGEVKVVYWDTLDDEISGLSDYIRARSDETFLVLVPRRFIGYRLAEAVGEDARTSFAEEALQHPIAQAAFAQLSLLADPDDFISTRAWLGLHGTKREHAQGRNSKAYSSLPEDIVGQELTRSIAKGDINASGTGSMHIGRRARLAVELVDRNMEPEDIIDLVFDEIIAEAENDDEKRRWLIRDLRELRSAAREELARQESPSLLRVTDTLRYRIATRAPLRVSDEEDPRVRIMTLHSAKGLEADNVVIAGVADQFMPGDTTDPEKQEEQRRLLYVAVTRAKASLIISWPRKIRMTDVLNNRGRNGQVRIFGEIKWTITSRSRLLPQGLSGVVRGEDLLA